MNIAREILEKHLSKDLDIKSYLRTSPLTYQVVLDAIEEAINYTRCCKSDSEQLCEHPMSERADIVGSYRTYCLKCSTTL